MQGSDPTSVSVGFSIALNGGLGTPGELFSRRKGTFVNSLNFLAGRLNNVKSLSFSELCLLLFEYPYSLGC